MNLSTEAEPPAAGCVFKRKKVGAGSGACFHRRARLRQVPRARLRATSPLKARRRRGRTPGRKFVEGLGWIGFDPSICLCMHDVRRKRSGLSRLRAAPAAPLAFGSRTESRFP